MSNAVTTAEAERDLPNVREDKPQMREYTVTVMKDGEFLPDSFWDVPPLPPLEPYTMVWDGKHMVPSRPLTGGEIAEWLSRPERPRMTPDEAEEWAEAVEEVRRIHNTPIIP